MNEQDRVRRAALSTAAKIDRLDRQLAREVIAAYGEARTALLGDLAAAFMSLGPEPTPEQVRMLLTRISLIRNIEARIDDLAVKYRIALENVLREVTALAHGSVAAEVALLAAGLGVTEYVALALNPRLELTVGPALANVPGLSTRAKQELTAALRSHLAQGDRMDEIARALFGKESSVFQRGLQSARLMGHRAVTEAENTARLAFLEQAAKNVPGLMKQAVARIDGKTSKTCLDVHGQTKKLDEPFDTPGPEAFARKQMSSPFHWGPCRTSVVGYHPDFEATSNTTSAALREAAAKERKRREKEGA